MLKLPKERGATSAALLDHLRSAPHDIGALPGPVDDPLFGDDSAIGLYTRYELHYRSFDEVSDGWEWEPSLLRERARLEDRFVASLFRRVKFEPMDPHEVVDSLQSMADDSSGPSLSSMMCSSGTLDNLREFAIHRSAYRELAPSGCVTARLRDQMTQLLLSS